MGAGRWAGVHGLLHETPATAIERGTRSLTLTVKRCDLVHRAGKAIIEP